MSTDSGTRWLGGALVAGVIYLLWTLFFYHVPLLHPGSYLFDLEGDGIVNYYTYLWHTSHDTILTSFDGMHYPYGEYLPYVDCHPALSSALQLLQRLGINPGPIGVPLLNLMMLLSGIPASVFLYLILRHFKVAVLRASVAAPAIIALSSQALLMQFGHYALSYTLFFPLGWYFLLKYNERPGSWKWSLLIILNILLWSYTHNYLGAILIGFTAISHIAVFTSNSKRHVSVKERLLRPMHVLVPAVIVYIIAVALDPHTGRIEMPFNPDHTASIYSVFLPNYAITRPLFEFFIDLTPQTQQSWARVGNYIGIPSLICVFVLIGTAIGGVLKRKSILPIGMRRIIPYLLASVVLLLISMGWHFRFTGPGWLEHMPLVKQFHGLGRFAWAFYYVICIATMVLIEQVRTPILRNILLTLAVGMYFFEAIGYHERVSERIIESPNYFDPQIAENKDLAKLESAINPEDYQAIVPLPFYHLSLTPGTLNAPDTAIYISMRFSWMTGLPLMSAMLSRYSIDEGRNIIQLFSPNQYEKSIEQDFPDRRPFILLLTGEPLETLESAVAGRGDTIAVAGDLAIAVLPFDAFFQYPHDEAVREFHEVYDTLQPSDGEWRLNNTRRHFEFKGFDGLRADQVYRGNGAWSGEIGEKQTLFISEPLPSGLEYELSFWYFNMGYDQVYNHMWVEEWDARDSVINRAYIAPTSGPLSDGPWFWNIRFGSVTGDGNRIILRSEGERRYSDVFYLDELMFRVLDVDVYRISGSDGEQTFLVNNETVARR